MSYPSTLLLLMGVLWLSLSQAQFLECDLGSKQMQWNTDKLMEFNGRLPLYRNESHSCVVKGNKGRNFLRLKVKKNGPAKGSVHVSVYAKGELALQGHLDVSEPTWSALTVCPTSSKANSWEKYLILSGTPNLTYTAQVDNDPLTIELDNPKDVTLTGTDVTVFQLIAPKDISRTQVDVTVTSPSDLPAYLKVSLSCKDVQENIRFVDYKGGSLRLSFAKQGRITLSKVSVPPLRNTQQTWFIGVALKDSKDSLQPTTTKQVTLTLTRSFGYQYAEPVCFMVFLPLLAGIMLTWWSWICFRVPLLQTLEENEQVYQCTKRNESQCLEEVTAQNSKGQSTIIAKSKLSFKEICQAMWEVLCHHWFTGGPKTFSYMTAIVGFVLLIGSYQYVFANWHLMIQEGDRDQCYYNDFCYRVSGYDIPFNLMISNLAYMIHAVILCAYVFISETMLLARCKRLAHLNVPSDSNTPHREIPPGSDPIPIHVFGCRNIATHLESMSVFQEKYDCKSYRKLYTEVLKRKHTLSIGYAFAWALFFEGCFSMLYHFCPRPLTFQFDTAFMFVIAGLVVISLFNGITRQECTEEKTEKLKKPLSATNFFLFFVAPLYIFNYFGTLYSSKLGLVFPMKVSFFVFLAFWGLVILVWAVFKLLNKTGGCKGLRENCENFTTAIFFLGFWVVVICIPVFFIDYVPDIFLHSCFVAVAATFFCCLLVRCCQSQRPNFRNDSETCKFIFQVFYTLLMLALSGVAVWVFISKPTSNKVKTPEMSRNLNRECIPGLNFFDFHDVWHMLSSFAILMWAPLILFISCNLPSKERKRKERALEDKAINSTTRGEQRNPGATSARSSSRESVSMNQANEKTPLYVEQRRSKLRSKETRPIASAVPSEQRRAVDQSRQESAAKPIGSHWKPLASDKSRNNEALRKPPLPPRVQQKPAQDVRTMLTFPPDT